MSSVKDLRKALHNKNVKIREQERTLKALFQLKLHIQKCQFNRDKHREKWMEHQGKVRSLSREIGDCQRKLLEMIENGRG